jgi:uncharacterized protein (TIGR02001 family)
MTGRGFETKKIVLAAVAALACSAGAALAADVVTKGRAVAVALPPPPAWDIAFGSAIMSDYIFRGITLSNHKPSVSAYFEPRYNVNPNLQLYAGISGESISFPNRAAAEIDFYGGFRPTFGKLALDFGFWYYWYPGDTCYNSAIASCQPSLANGNVIKSDLSFWEVYAKATYTVTDPFVLGLNFFYTPSFLNSGAPGEYLSGTAKYTFPTMANGVAWYLSGELGYQWLGTGDAFYGVPAFPAGINYQDYATWNVGLGFTWKVFTLDLRYSDTNLSRGDCNAFTSDFTAGGTTDVTAINPSGVGSRWCGAAFIAKLSADLTVNANLK